MASVASAKIEGEEQTSQSPASLPKLCLTATLKHGKSDALNHKVDGEWIHIAATTFVERVRHVALGLAQLGIKRGDRIALLSENRPEWSSVDLAILSIGAVNVPIYTTQAVDQIRVHDRPRRDDGRNRDDDFSVYRQDIRAAIHRSGDPGGDCPEAHCLGDEETR